jgi:uncharacterized protein YdeI (YjbR/CyaY-like superfamily)
MAGENLPTIEITSRAALRAWLAAHHATAGSTWLITHKKSEGAKYVSYDDVVEELLCFGWVDSLPRKLDDKRSMLLIAPRKPASNWSKLNKDRALRMIAAGQMMPSGMALIETAKQHGAWTALDLVEELALPEDLIAQLGQFPNASACFEAFPKSAKRGILEWILNAKTDATRQKRIEETARLANENIRANQWRQPGKP